MIHRSPLCRLTLVVVMLAASSCRGADSLAPVDGLGVVSGRWDGVPWQGYGYGVIARDTLHLVGHRPDPRYYYDEYVRVRVPFAGVGTYSVPLGGASLAKIVGGDAGSFPDAQGELRVTRSDTGPTNLRGALGLTAPGPEPDWRFQLGEFDVPVYGSFAAVPRVPGR